MLTAVNLSIPGQHNIYNALAAISTAHTLGVSLYEITKRLEAFGGVKRRFEEIGSVNGITVVDDYAHHPTEIKAMLHAAQNHPHENIWCVFQPHTYTRTHELMLEFAVAFKDADKIIITDIYAAREVNDLGVHSKDLVKLLEAEGDDVLYIESFDDIINHINTHAQPGDLLLTVGAGNVNDIAYRIVQN